jgi:hypothetical protein
MLMLLALLRRARTVRPLLWWVAGLFVYVVAPVPQEWVLLLIVGLGVALTVTLMRLREKVHRVAERSSWGATVAERLTQAVEDRIRGEYALSGQQPPTIASMPVAMYDPGALLSAIVAVLAAEGVPTNAAPALPACAQLLAWQNIASQPAAPAPTAHRLVQALAPAGTQRPYRAMSPVLLAQLVRIILTHDGVLPAQIDIDAADALIEGSFHTLHALAIAPDDGAGGIDRWPVLGSIIDAAPLAPPTQQRW